MLNLLEDREKKILRNLGLALGAVLVFLVFFSLPQKKRCSDALSHLEEKKREYRHFHQIAQEREAEWRRWQTAFIDIDELKLTYFYDGNQIPQQLRTDLEKVLNKAGTQASRISYTYTEFKKEEVKKVSVIFNIRGPYMSLKRFLLTVEELPKFLLVEKIDFQDIDARRGMLELKMTLAGYYEN